MSGQLRVNQITNEDGTGSPAFPNGVDAAGLTGNVAAARITNALNASGSAPIYACRAWVNFNGTGTVAIRSSGNVSSITDGGTGVYTVNFTTAMADADYATVGMAQRPSANNRGGLLDIDPSTAYTTTSVRVRGITVDTSPGVMDVGTACVAVFD